MPLLIEIADQLRPNLHSRGGKAMNYTQAKDLAYVEHIISYRQT